MQWGFKFVLYVAILCITVRLVFYHRLRYKVEYVYKLPNDLRHYFVWPDEGANSSDLVDMTTILFPVGDRPIITTRQQMEKLAPFDIKMSHGQYATIEKLICQFEKVMISLRLQDQWFLGKNALLGSLQHHDMIPWDDGVDICVQINHRQRVQFALRQLAPEFEMKTHNNEDLLYFKPLSDGTQLSENTLGSFPFSKTPWPFISIFYFEEVGRNLAKEFGNDLRRFNLSDVFPLTYRPFGKHWFPTPRKPIRFLKNYFPGENFTCSSQSYSRGLSKKLEQTFMDCRKLMERYSFVQRCPISVEGRRTNSSYFCDEYLVDSHGRTLHKIRTVLEPDEILSPLYAVKHESFNCP